MKNKSKCKARIDFIKRLFQTPEGTVLDYYHGNYIYRIKEKNNDNSLEEKNNKKEKEEER